jgi:hypothetical protein
VTAEWWLARALAALRDGAAEPWKAVDPSPGAEAAWPQIVAAKLARFKLGRLRARHNHPP